MSQKSILGFRSGLMILSSNKVNDQFSGRQSFLKNHFSWGKELYIRTPIKNKWHTEIALTSYNYRTDRITAGITYDQKVTVVESNIIVLYDVSRPLIVYFPYLSKLTSYMGLVIAPQMHINRGNPSGIDDRPESVISYKTGLQFSTFIPIYKKLGLSSAIKFKTKPFDKYYTGNYIQARPNAEVTWLTGMYLRI
ncbi:MAG: hypothetical protein JNJ58_10570 [Chitinophagaceae bacterium]|nr:hypothetical protein [Chitinophagaceae bacterium]